MFKKIIFAISFLVLLSKVALAEKVIVFDFTEDEYKTLKVKKIKGRTTWTLGSNKDGRYIKAEAEGKGERERAREREREGE